MAIGMKTSNFLILTIYCRIITADRYMKMYNLVCEPVPKWVENATCHLKVVGRNDVVANMDMDIKETFKNVTIHFQLFKFYNQFRPFLIDITFNMCDVLKQKSISNFYVNQLKRVLSKYGNNGVKCPMEVSDWVNSSVS